MTKPPLRADSPSRGKEHVPSSQTEPIGHFLAERTAAHESRDYHSRHRDRLGLEGKRRALAAFAETIYARRLGLSPTPGESATFRAIRDPDTLLLEVAHDGQLPHLGIVRLVLKAHDVARLDHQAATLYLVGNHYSADMRPDNIHFGMPLLGNPPNLVKHPPKLRIGKASARTPFRFLPPPGLEELSALRGLVGEFVVNNLGHERKAGVRLAEDARDKVEARLGALFGVLGRASEGVDNLGDWLIRVQHDLFREMLGPEADAILFLPMMEFAELFRDELARIANSRQVVFGIKENVSADQSASGQEPYQRTTEPSSFWLYCPACFRRSRATWVPGATVNHNCGSCGDRRELTDPEIWRWLMPDIVAYEAGAFRMGIGGWVTGSRAPYHPVIEHLYRELYGIEMPPKFFVRSIPTFQGIGEPPEGYRKTRLLRAWLESTPSALAAALRAPWDENPAIRSDLLPAP